MNDAKTALGQKIVAAKKAKGWTWPQVAEKLGHAPVWVCAACLGQMSMTEETAEKAGVLFDLAPAEGLPPDRVKLLRRLDYAIPILRRMLDALSD